MLLNTVRRLIRIYGTCDPQSQTAIDIPFQLHRRGTSRGAQVRLFRPWILLHGVHSAIVFSVSVVLSRSAKRLAFLYKKHDSNFVATHYALNSKYSMPRS